MLSYGDRGQGSRWCFCPECFGRQPRAMTGEECSLFLPTPYPLPPYPLGYRLTTHTIAPTALTPNTHAIPHTQHQQPLRGHGANPIPDPFTLARLVLIGSHRITYTLHAHTVTTFGCSPTHETNTPCNP